MHFIPVFASLSPAKPQSKMYRIRWTVFYGIDKTVFSHLSHDNRLRIAVRFSHVSSQVFLTAEGI